MSSLNGACVCYKEVVDGIAESLGTTEPIRIPTGNSEFDKALECAEKLRAAICRQFDLSRRTTWDQILLDAGVADVEDEKEKARRFTASMSVLLEPTGKELSDELDLFRSQITGQL